MPQRITAYCQLLQDIAEEVWEIISRSRRTNTHFPEIGITAYVISRLKDKAGATPGIGIWSAAGLLESIWGSDIDIFIEVQSNKYIWFACQAKVLYVNGEYSDLHKLFAHKEHQWTKLKRLQFFANCEPYYLLFNGGDEYNINSIDQCLRNFNTSQYGCSLVTLYDVENSTDPVSFGYFHPLKAQPWRILGCCELNNKHYKTYAAEQIEDAIRYYPQGPQDFFLGYPKSNQLSNPNINAIVRARQLTGWNPVATIVLKQNPIQNSDVLVKVT